MANVFIVNEPDETRVPPGRQSWDISPAAHFGDIVYVFPASQEPPVRNREYAIDRAHDVLSEADEGDFIVWAGGDPFGMVLAASVLSEYTGGKFNYLMWDRMARSYAPIPVELFDSENNDE